MKETYEGTPHDAREVMIDLIVGCVLHGLFYGLVGCIVVENKAAFAAGIGLGTLVACGLAVSMTRSVETCVDLPPDKAQRTMMIRSICRMLVMLMAGWIAIRYPFFSFPGVIIGLLGLKVAAYLHIYINVYITGRLRKKGR